MRTVINSILICIFLFVGGQSLHADTSSTVVKNFSPFTTINKEKIKHKKVEPANVLIEEVGLDLDEEFHRSDDVNNGANKFFPAKHSLLGGLYPISNTFLLKNYAKQFECFLPNCGYTSPIYLRIGVLRI